MSEKEIIIKFIGKKTYYDGQVLKQRPVDDDKIPRWRRSGSLVFHLPDGATQKRGFTHPLSSEILKRWPSKFKPVRGFYEHTSKRNR